MNPKKAAAERAVEYIQDGMIVGLGTGSTAAFAISALHARILSEGLEVTCIPTSRATAESARSVGIPLSDWDTVRKLDLTIDGADEVDPAFRLIKGGGGALLREKIVASATDHQIIVVDDHKLKAALGVFPLPVAVVPFGWQATRDRLEYLLSAPVTPRKTPKGDIFISDDSLYILDIHFGGPLPDPDALTARIKTITGVIETGLFIGLCHRVIVGHLDGTTSEAALGYTAL
ncbi:MAG: ribose 5-phosphate isomerase [Capsulimonas sp.]|nr:ribose 5-phosphate isomerase [Capsulimonas sp.]